MKVDTRACLEYLTENVDPMKVLNDPLIKDNKELLWQMAAADPPVDLFDPTTWSSEVDYKPLCDVIHAYIAPHMCQNQRIESYVHMHAVVAQTHVKEVRRAAQAVLHSTISRPFNQESVEAKRSNIDNAKDKEKIKRIRGRQRTEMLGKYVCDLNKDINRAMASMDPDLWGRVL